MAVRSKKIRSRTRIWDSLVRMADPWYERDKRREVEYEFANGKRRFFGDPSKRGPYSDGNTPQE